MLDEMKSRADAASGQLADLQRQSESADPSRRAALESEVAQAREVAATAHRELNEVATKTVSAELIGAGAEAGFSSGTAAAVETAKTEQREISNVSIREGSSGSRINPFARKETFVETHMHPDLLEAKLANAASERNAERLAAERADRMAAATATEAKSDKDRDRAARIFEGGHDRGLGTADYLKIEADHKAEMANFARNAEAAGQVQPQASDAGTAQRIEQPQAAEHAAESAQLEVIDQPEAAVAVEQTAETGVGHIVMTPGQELEGEIVAEVRVKDVVYHSVEFSDDGGQTKRTLVNTGGNEWSVGDAVQVVRTSKGFEIEPSRDYGR